MHLHLPKPLHGWRAFTGEVGIIVIGVLIALGAEQVVEGMHWRHTVETERRALDGDVADMWNAMSGRVIIEHCVDQRLAELKLVLDRHKHGQSLGIFGPVGRPGVWTASANALQMASADQSLSHMSFADKQAYFGVYGSYADFERAAFEERATWRTLDMLNDPESLDETDWRDVRRAYQNALDSNRAFKANLVFGTSGQWLTPFAHFGRFPDNKAALTIPMVQDLCRPAVKR